jgi:hypothetical protein
VKDIGIESFLCNLEFIGIDSEKQREGMWLEAKGAGLSDRVRCETCGWDGEV